MLGGWEWGRVALARCLSTPGSSLWGFWVRSLALGITFFTKPKFVGAMQELA